MAECLASWVHAERANCNLKNASAGLGHSTASCIDETAYKTAVNYAAGQAFRGNWDGGKTWAVGRTADTQDLGRYVYPK